MLACAWGRPSDAFGAMYRGFDGTRRTPRLPGPPYHFMSRVVRIDGRLGDCRPGMQIVAEYDVPPDAWYFDENGDATMPFAVLLEAALQPCGWLATLVGSSVAEARGSPLPQPRRHRHASPARSAATPARSRTQRHARRTSRGPAG